MYLEQNFSVSMAASTGVFCSGNYLGYGGPVSAGRRGHARYRNRSTAGGEEGPGRECGKPLRNKLQRGRINSVVVRGWGSVGSVGWGSATGAVIGGSGPTRRLKASRNQLTSGRQPTSGLSRWVEGG